MKHALRFFLSLILFLSILKTYAQTEEIRCYTAELTEKARAENPGVAQQLKLNSEAIKQWIANHPEQRTRGIITIPVVVHLVYNVDSPHQQLTDWQIISQIDAMNEDFSRQNADAYKTPEPFKQYAADCEIQFCLAKRDSAGKLTTGIVRVETNRGSFGGDFDAIKHNSTGGSDGWDYKRYFNIWVGELENGILGYSTLPGQVKNNTDGCVINSKAFGRINTKSPKYTLGRTGTHEAGHWFNLMHVWGDDGGKCPGKGGWDDDVADTPPQEKDNTRCQTFPHISCDNGPYGDMYMNYLDYSYDSCMNMFTKGQKERMQAAIDTLRHYILSVNSCTPPSKRPLDIGISNISQPTMNVANDSIYPVITLNNYGADTVTSATIYYMTNVDGHLYSHAWTGKLATDESASVPLPGILDSMGYQVFIAFSKNPNGKQDADSTNDFRTRSYYVSYVPPPPIKNDRFYIYNPDPSASGLGLNYTKAILRFDTLSVKDIKQYEITNILGQRLLYHALPANQVSPRELELDVSALPTGLYFIRVRMANDYMDEKLLIIRPK